MTEHTTQIREANEQAVAEEREAARRFSPNGRDYRQQMEEDGFDDLAKWLKWRAATATQLDTLASDLSNIDGATQSDCFALKRCRELVEQMIEHLARAA
jgi:hypothetical protein